MDKKIEMTAEREGKILENVISGMGKECVLLDTIRAFADFQHSLSLAVAKHIAEENLPEDADIIKMMRMNGDYMLKELMKHAIAEASARLNMLSLIYGDATEEEIRELEKLEKAWPDDGEEADEDA